MSVRESMLETRMWNLADHHGVFISHSKKEVRVHSTRSSPEMNRKEGGVLKKVGSMKEVCPRPKVIIEECNRKIKNLKGNYS